MKPFSQIVTLLTTVIIVCSAAGQSAHAQEKPPQVVAASSSTASDLGSPDSTESMSGGIESAGPELLVTSAFFGAVAVGFGIWALYEGAQPQPECGSSGPGPRYFPSGCGSNLDELFAVTGWVIATSGAVVTALLGGILWLAGRRVPADSAQLQIGAKPLTGASLSDVHGGELTLSGTF